MKLVQLKISIPTGAEGDPAGYDSVIIKAPDRWYVTVDGRRAFLARVAIRDLRQRSMDDAKSIGEELHHADWTVTSDPAEVRTLGLVHDCASCRAGIDQALAFLRDNPDGQVAVGQLWWRQQ